MRTMRKASIIVLALIPASLIACKKNEEEAPPQSGYQQQPGQYPPQQQQPGQYPAQQQQPGYTQPQTQPVPGQAPATTLSTPDATAFPCQSDAQCVTHRCNTQFGKCAYPCRADT